MTSSCSSVFRAWIIAIIIVVIVICWRPAGPGSGRATWDMKRFLMPSWRAFRGLLLWWKLEIRRSDMHPTFSWEHSAINSLLYCLESHLENWRYLRGVLSPGKLYANQIKEESTTCCLDKPAACKDTGTFFFIKVFQKQKLHHFCKRLLYALKQRKEMYLFIWHRW